MLNNSFKYASLFITLSFSTIVMNNVYAAAAAATSSEDGKYVSSKRVKPTHIPGTSGWESFIPVDALEKPVYVCVSDGSNCLFSKKSIMRLYYPGDAVREGKEMLLLYMKFLMLK